MSDEKITPAQLRQELGLPPKPGDFFAAVPDLRAYARQLRQQNKYGVAPVGERTYDGIIFDSKGEMNRWCVLLWEERAGAIAELERQITYRLVVNGIKISRFTADFRYRRAGELVVEDFKSRPTRTRAYVMRRKLMKAIHGIDVLETEAAATTTGKGGT